MKKIVLFLSIFSALTLIARADNMATLPLGSAASTNINDSFPYTNSAANLAWRLNLSDIVNIPAMVATYAPIASPTFTGTVTAPTIVLSSGATIGYCWEATSSGGAGAWAACSSFDNPMTTLGDLIYGGSSGTPTRLAGNTSATKEFLTQTGSGSVSAEPAWGTLLSGDIPNNAANTTGNSATATALASSPSQCTGTEFAQGIDADGDANCAIPSGGGGGVTTVGTYGSQSSSSDGAVISSSDIYFQDFTSSNPGMVPASGGGTSDFLRADGSWETPPGSSYTFDAPLVNTAGTVTCDVASGSQAGCLSDTDWTTFNDKEGALTFADSLVDTAGTVALSGDASSPGDSYYYGTDSGGTKGFYALPSSGGSPGGEQYSIQTNSGSSSFSGDDYFLYNGSQATFDLVDSYGGFHVEGRSGGEASFALQPDTVSNGSSGQWIFYTNGSQLNSPADFAMYDSATGAPALILQASTGYVGIDENNPPTALGVNGTVSASGLNASSLTASEAVFSDGSDNLVSNSITGSGDVVMSTSPTLVTPALGVPASGVMTNVTGLPLTSGVTGVLPIANGGTDATSITANSVILGNGTSALSGNLVAPGTSGNVLEDNGTTWVSAGAPSAASSSKNLLGLGLAVGVSGDGVTVALKQSDGSTNPSSGTPVYIGIRSSTAASGAYNQESVTGALSITAPHLATLGQISGNAEQTDVFAQDDSGTLQLCLATAGYFDEGTVQASTTIGTGSTSRATLYCTAGVSGAIRHIGRFISTQATSGVWLTSPSEVAVLPAQYASVTSSGSGQYHTESAVITDNGSTCVVSGSASSWVSAAWSGTGTCALTFLANEFSAAPQCFAESLSDGLRPFNSVAETPLGVTISLNATTTNALVDGNYNVFCMGPH